MPVDSAVSLTIQLHFTVWNFTFSIQCLQKHLL
jgi:hypothetical protein